MFDGITNRGSQYLAKCQASGTGIILAKVKIGDGVVLSGENPSTFLDIKSIKQEVDISEKTQVESNLRLVIQFDNGKVESGYFPREIGIYAMDGEEEILYWYINDGDQTSWLPPASKSPVKFKYGVNIMATNSETTIVNWSGKELWVDREFLNKELEKKQDLTDNRLLTKAKKIWEAINELFNDKQNETDNTLLTTVKTIVGAINELFNNKLEKGGYTGNAKNLNDEISKKASKTQLGRMLVGANLTVDGDGRVDYVHPTSSGNKHIPSGGAAGQYLKYSASGTANWVTPTASEIGLEPITPSELQTLLNRTVQ